MKRLTFICMVLLVGVCAAFVPPEFGQQHEHPAGDPGKLGKVSFSVSCEPSVQPQFSSAVAMLHSFWYEKASDTFAAVAQKDPTCGMAYWGIAMTYYHQVWQAPGPEDLEAGIAAVEKAKLAGAKTERERDYIAAIETFYKDAGQLDYRTRALAYEKAMDQLQARYPDDHEAGIFYALALLATAPPTDKTYVNQKNAGAILEPLFAEQPEHPGIAHYIIHAYDYPPLADRALDAARRYAQIAPDAPHALHMPSHIFTRLGLWQESIHSNLASAAAARKQGLAGDELHATDYLVYAYLQTGQDRDARMLVESTPMVRPNDAAYFAGLYTTASIPARLAIEEHRWQEVATLSLPPNIFPGGRYRWTEADCYFARGLGSARSRDVMSARTALQQLTSIHDDLSHDGDQLSASLVDIQRKTVSAWISFAQGHKDQGLIEMRSAADEEDATDRPPVAPGPIVPARELLGEMLLESQQPALALEAFEVELRVAPGRLNGLYGAGRAAEREGDLRKAENYF